MNKNNMIALTAIGLTVFINMASPDSLGPNVSLPTESTDTGSSDTQSSSTQEAIATATN